MPGLRRSRWSENHAPRHPQAAELVRLAARRRLTAPFTAEERALQARLDEEMRAARAAIEAAKPAG